MGRGRGDRDDSRGRRRKDSRRRSPRANNVNEEQRQRDKRPDIERKKGGVKLFVGRVPQEASEALLRKTFERFGSVLEVFKMRGERPGEERHSLYHEDGLTCAFVRVKDVSAAQEAIEVLHDKEILLKNRRDTGPIQVAFARGEAQRLGLDTSKEHLPNRLEGKELVRQIKERMILAAPDQQSFKFRDNGNPFWFPTDPLINIIQEGRRRDRMWENCWRHYCSEGWGGTYEINPLRMPHHGLVQFVMMRTVDYQDAEWFLGMVKHTHLQLKNGDISSTQRRELPPPSPEKKPIKKTTHAIRPDVLAQSSSAGLHNDVTGVGPTGEQKVDSSSSGLNNESKIGVEQQNSSSSSSSSADVNDVNSNENPNQQSGAGSSTDMLNQQSGIQPDNVDPLSNHTNNEVMQDIDMMDQVKQQLDEIDQMQIEGGLDFEELNSPQKSPAKMKSPGMAAANRPSPYKSPHKSPKMRGMSNNDINLDDI